jgi:hypothetical protein
MEERFINGKSEKVQKKKKSMLQCMEMGKNSG